MIVSPIPVCAACADGQHDACARLGILVADGGYPDPDAEYACSCRRCWGNPA